MTKQQSSDRDRDGIASELEDQAWVWLRLFASGRATHDDGDRFRRWVRADAAHQAAYGKVKQAWDAMKAPAGQWLRSDPGILALHRDLHGLPRRAAGRRALLGAALGAAAVAGVAMVYPPFRLWPAPSEWGADYRTMTGEQRTLAMADNIAVTLNTQTSVRHRTGSGQTIGLELLEGEAMVEARRTGGRFSVVAGNGRSSVDSGQFEIRYLEQKACVTCIDGMVLVQHPAGTRNLNRGQQTVYDANTISGIAGTDPASVASWRKGLLVFQETRLADAISEINRYRRGRVILTNEAARDKRVSGSFPISALDKALWQMQQTFHLQSRSVIGGVVILS